MPATPRRPVENQYHGQTVVDDYQWLEDWSDPEVRAWSEAQNTQARAYLDRIPGRDAIGARIEELTRSLSPGYSQLRFAGGRFFAIKDQPPKQQPFLVTRDSLEQNATETVLVDPNSIDPSGSTHIDFFVPSPDGALVAVSMSEGGTEDGTVYVFDTATGERLPDSVPRVNGGTAAGSVGWCADGKAFYHTQYPRPGERPEADLSFYQQVYLHQLGTPAEADTYSLGREVPKIAEIALLASSDGRYLLAAVKNGDGGEHAFWILDSSEGGDSWKPVAGFEDECVGARFGTGEDRGLYLLSYKDALNGKIIRLPLPAARLSEADVLVAESEVAIVNFRPAASRIYVKDMIGGPAQLRIFDLEGSSLGMIPVPELSSINGMLVAEDDTLFFQRESFTEPGAWYRFDPATGRVTLTALEMRSPADFSDIEVRRELATSKDGTRVPMSILMRKGTPLDGSAPLILYGYGGYGINMAPSFRPARHAWFDQGGIYAIANLRGGGEYGEAWHRTGMLTRKQNVFDDFIACAEHLIEQRFTSRDRLAIEGGSNGGILMGAMITQRPELFRAVVTHVGIYDMLRVELDANGEFNITEFGTVEDPGQWKALYAYSPYHHVKDGAASPSVLFMTGANDPRVNPLHSRKMTARLQAAGTPPPRILLRTSSTTGHGGGTPLSARVAQLADVYAFLCAELGVDYREGGSGPR
jgi:prolyl oligopeptidase